MKLSNKILIGFFGLTFIYMIAAFTEVRFKGDLNRFNDTNSISETIDIPGVNHLILSNIEYGISVVGSNNPKIEIKSVSGNLIQHLKYEISGDSLIINQIELKRDQYFKIYIHVPKSTLKSINVNNTNLTISDLAQDNLDISQSDGWLRFAGNNQIGKLNLQIQNNAYFNLSNGNLDTLSAIINNSEVRITTPIKLVMGSMNNKANLNLSNTKEIQFTKDESSRIYMN